MFPLSGFLKTLRSWWIRSDVQIKFLIFLTLKGNHSNRIAKIYIYISEINIEKLGRFHFHIS